ncbi:MAG: aminotransferase class V-fold PLP-dependent enzyme [Ekhidna sp.]|nr:aminotransferase class V-fold PLP-dependent enzyme [Ekhidna sp.]
MKCQRKKFFLQRKNAYFNCAYMSPSMKKVENAGIAGIKSKRNPAKFAVDDFFNETTALRNNFSKLINNEEPERTVIIPSVSYGIANAVNNLKFTNGKIVLAGEQFPSNVYPWVKLQEKGLRVEFVEAPNSKQRGEDWNASLLESIDSETRAVAIGHVHWSDGTRFLLEEIRNKLDQVGGLLIVDGTQSVGALPFDVQQIRPDALIVAGYKWLMGPYSIGMAYYGSAFDGGQPIEENWINRMQSEDFANLVKYQDDYRPKAIRYEVGEHSNFILVPMLNTAIKQLLKWGPENIQEYLDRLLKSSVSEIVEMGYQIEDSNWRANHLFGIRVPEKISREKLNHSLKKHRISVSNRGDAIRVAPHVYNDEIDVRKLLKALKEPIFA